MIWHDCTLMVWSNNYQNSMGTPCGARTGPTPKSPMFLISYGTRTGPMWDPQGCRTPDLRTRKGIDTTRIGKTPTRRRIWPYRARTGPLRAPQGLFTGCLQSLNLYGARKLIMHASKLYGPRTGRLNSYGAARGSCGRREWTYDFVQNSPGTARTGPGSVMWLRHKIVRVNNHTQAFHFQRGMSK